MLHRYRPAIAALVLALYCLACARGVGDATRPTDCPTPVAAPREAGGQVGGVIAAIDYVIVDGELYHHVSPEMEPPPSEVGPLILTTTCRIGYVEDPDPRVDGYASSLPRGTAIHRTSVGDDATVVAIVREQRIAYRQR